MSSLRQIAANRRNALKSTGPITAEGKENSRGNAVRHGLTAETVIATLEDQDDYLGFQAVVIADYAAETAVERELVLRLASILWRLRRSTGIETALFESMIEVPQEPKQRSSAESLGPSPDHPEHNQSLLRAVAAPSVAGPSEPSAGTMADIASCYLRLMRQPTFALDRLSRYEHTLWRQTRQLVFTLETLQRRKQRHIRSGFPFASRRSEPGIISE
jgi:hypothetical protein